MHPHAYSALTRFEWFLFEVMASSVNDRPNIDLNDRVVTT